MTFIKGHDDPVYPVNSCFTQIFEWRTKNTLLVTIFPWCCTEFPRIPWFSMFREIPEYSRFSRFVATLPGSAERTCCMPKPIPAMAVGGQECWRPGYVPREHLTVKDYHAWPHQILCPCHLLSSSSLHYFTTHIHHLITKSWKLLRQLHDTSIANFLVHICDKVQ